MTTRDLARGYGISPALLREIAKLDGVLLPYGNAELTRTEIDRTDAAVSDYLYQRETSK